MRKLPPPFLISLSAIAVVFALMSVAASLPVNAANSDQNSEKTPLVSPTVAINLTSIRFHVTDTPTAQSTAPGNGVSNTSDLFAKNQLIFESESCSYEAGFYSINSDGENFQGVNIAGFPNSCMMPYDWSPDGRYLLVGNNPISPNFGELWLIDYFNRTTFRKLVTVDNAPIAEAAWSTDGKYIIYTHSYYPVGGSGRIFSLNIMKPDGTQIQEILSTTVSAPISNNGFEIFWINGSEKIGVGVGCSVDSYTLSESQSGFALGTPTRLITLNSDCNYLHISNLSPDRHYISLSAVFPEPNWQNRRRQYLFDFTVLPAQALQEISTSDTTDKFYNAIVVDWRPDAKALVFRTAGFGTFLRDLTDSTTKTISLTRSAFRLAWRRAWNTIGVYRPSTNTFLLRNSLTTGSPDLIIPFNYGSGAKLPIMGDWNGDGVDKVGVYSVDVFYLSNSNTSAAANHVFAFGNPGDTPLSGRWEANAPHDGVGVFRPSNGILYLKNELTTGFSDYYGVLGNQGDVGIAGDWDSNGQDSPGVYRPGNNTWYLSNTSNPNGIIFGDQTWQFTDTSYDSPITGDWVGLAQNFGGLNNAGIADVNGDPAPLQFVLFDSTVANSPGRYLAVYGESSDKPVVGRFTTPVIGRGAPSTNTPRPSRTPIPCQVTIRQNNSTYHGPSFDDLEFGNVSVGQKILLVAKAIDEEGKAWYGIDHPQRVGVYTWIPAIGEGGESGLPQPVINEWEVQNCNGRLADGNTKSDPPPWTQHIGVNQSPQLPIQPNQLSTPVTSFNGFAVIDSINYSLIPGCYHPGLDLQAQSGSEVYSMFAGIVVGIGRRSDPDERPASWGAVGLQGSGQMNVVIRSGSHYVLYGHLSSFNSSLFYGKQIAAGTLIGYVANQQGNSHLHVEIRTFPNIDDANLAIRPKFGAIKRTGQASPRRAIDLMAFVAQRGTVQLTSVPISDCTNPVIESINRRLRGALLAPNSFGNATLVYAVRATQEGLCFDINQRGNPYQPNQCISIAPNTRSAPIPTPTLQILPTFTPTP